MSFQKPFEGTRNVWVKKTGEPFAAARVVTFEKKRPLGGYFWSRDSKYILCSAPDVVDSALGVNYCH